MRRNSFTHIRPENMTDSCNISNITLALKGKVDSLQGKENSCGHLCFVSGFSGLDRPKVTEVVITTGKKRKKWFTAQSERNENEEEDHESRSGGQAHTSVLCGAHHSLSERPQLQTCCTISCSAV